MKQVISEHERCIQWMSNNNMNCKQVDLTYSKTQFPEFVRKWIINTWTKTCDGDETYVNTSHVRPTLCLPRLQDLKERVRFLLLLIGLKVLIMVILKNERTPIITTNKHRPI